ncbi:MAG: helix-turn-helix transcriptional regulator, partial [Caedimonadaceae bacterium]
MTTHGELMRELRIKKGITQKELYEDIMSKSYAIRFEQGKHEISFYLIQSILERLGMEIDEFIYIYNEYHESNIEQFYNEY